MPLRLFQIDAFTDRPFAGNPAGVCLLDTPAADGWMQAVAAETGLPATAFVAPAPVPGPAGDWWLRWYSGRTELTLCGHGTLAASHALVHELGVPAPVIRYATVAGALTARSVGGGRIELDLPAHPPLPAPGEAGPVAAALYRDGTAPPIDTYRGFEDLLAVVPSVHDVERLVVDAGALATVKARCVIVSAAADPAAGGPDIVSRVFAVGTPSIGEDAVTGSAHCLLGPFWSDRLGRPRLAARQASARGGDLEVDVRGDRVALTGRAVTVLRGELDGAITEGSRS